MDETTKAAKHWGCPECGSTALAHMERAIVLYPVRVVDNPSHPGSYLFECNNCSEEFSEPILTDKDPDD